MTHDGGRVRARRGPARLVRGIPYSDSDTTLSLIPGAAIGEWLADHAGCVKGRLLDSGCGNRPYGTWYAPLTSSSLGLDAAPGLGVDVIGFADQLPFGDQTFDTVMCTEVLEHVGDSERAVREMCRVLRPGGHVLASVPFLYPIHEAPYDMRRYTYFGLRALFERNGFEVVSLQCRGGAARMLLHFFVLAVVGSLQMLGKLTRVPLLDKRPVRAAVAGPQLAFIKMRPTPRSIGGSATRVSLGYMIVARRR